MYFSHLWRCHHYRCRAAKFRPKLCAQGHWAERDFYRATPAVTVGLDFSGLIWRTAPFSLLRHTKECREFFLSRILTGPHSVTSWVLTTQKGMWRTYSNLDDMMLVGYISHLYTDLSQIIWHDKLWTIISVPPYTGLQYHDFSIHQWYMYIQLS
jgi:hypothetical protein